MPLRAERADAMERAGRVGAPLLVSMALAGCLADDAAESTELAGDVADGCDAESLGEGDGVEFVVAYRVVNGGLGPLCFGSSDDTVLDAWDLLAAITPLGQLGDLEIFAGFVSDGSGDDSGDDDGEDETTLAFVNTIDDDGTGFQMSINIDEAVTDRNELQLTVAHEFSHVFTELNTQLDRTDEAIDRCDTYFNGDGCYLEDSLMVAWVDAFWLGGPDGDLLDEIDPDAEATAADGQSRCDRSAGFFGAYAASNPEEDFAETFSAYVFRVPAASDAQQAKLDWIDDQPGLAEFRSRAVAADLGPLPNNFDPCG